MQRITFSLLVTSNVTVEPYRRKAFVDLACTFYSRYHDSLETTLFRYKAINYCKFRKVKEKAPLPPSPYMCALCVSVYTHFFYKKLQALGLNVS